MASDPTEVTRQERPSKQVGTQPRSVAEKPTEGSGVEGKACSVWDAPEVRNGCGGSEELEG